MKKKKFNPKTYKFTSPDRPLLFLIIWDDHNSSISGSWQDLRDIVAPRPLKVRSVGWVIAANNECITIVPTISEEGQNVGSINILKRAIVDAKKISDGPKWSSKLELKDAVHRR